MSRMLLLVGWALTAGPALAQNLVINEFLASNSSVNTDEHGDHDDWVEIWNPGDAPVDLGGLWASDGGTPWQIPAGQPELTTIEAGGFLLLWFDEEPGQGPLHIDDKLSAGGESVVLYAADGVMEIARHDYEAQQQNISEGREFDGAEEWTSFATPTPGASNGTSAVESAHRPRTLALAAAPNPFNPSTRVSWEQRVAGPVDLAVLDLAGRRVDAASLGWRAAGTQEFAWRPAASLASGRYWLVLTAGGERATLPLSYIQ